MATPKLDRMLLLKGLETIKYERDEDRGSEDIRRMSLAGAILGLAKIDHESELALCQSVAKHLLGKVPEPDDVDIGEE